MTGATCLLKSWEMADSPNAMPASSPMAPKPAHIPDALVKEHFSSIELNNPMGTMGRILKVTAIMRGTLLERKANPQDDMISMLWQTRIDDEKMTLATLAVCWIGLFLAGIGA